MTPQMRILITADNKTRPVMQQVVDDAQKTGAGVNNAMHLAGGGVANLASQFNDIGVMLASGQSPLILAIQQGTQISQVIGPMGAAGAAKALGSAFMSMISPVSLLTIGFIAAGAATVQWLMGLANGGDDAKRSLGEMAAPLESVRSQIGELRNITDTYAKAIKDSASIQSAATDSIVANSEREFNAKKSLLELELKRQQAAITASKAELSMKGNDLRKEVSQGTLGAGVSNDVMGGYSDPKIGQFVRSPAQGALLERTKELIEGSPLNDQMKELRANIELAEIASLGLEEALGTTFGESVAISIATIGEKTKKTKEEFDVFKQLTEDLGPLISDANDPFIQLQSNLDKLGAWLHHEGPAGWATYAEGVRRANMIAYNSVAGSLGQITGALAGAFQDNKALAVANAGINTAEGITKALAQGGMFAVPIAAAIGVAGAAQIASILSTQPGSTSVAPVSAAASPAAAPAAGGASASSQRNLFLDVRGDSFGRGTVEKMAQDLVDLLKDGGAPDLRVILSGGR